ncbi:hypothetical protein PPL_05584 [Heterostelium album PN500]|uniref:Uncharacterized protein n=1 Tax=Heterostelium pallidum (strain ATCC 26659 / Pp 5 / PN500) TaxID=670386 RepID=D3BAK6_HETP5|nr:hypothetical protein PPL_05584 [Heterostelium album PN500]EFA81593.1 hypothetical protein PPL_05584 [Heterostelium album PN500]|eukprot:XP_020433710.1 hypothetical protein PPL_05584 [Heterostelium album PN500]
MKFNFSIIFLVLSFGCLFHLTNGCKPSMIAQPGGTNGQGYFYVQYPFINSQFQSIISLEGLYFNKTNPGFVAHQSGNYNFTFNCWDGTSITASYPITVPRLTVDQPKCYASKVNITFSEPCFVVNINDDGMPTTGPWELSTSRPFKSNTFKCETGENNNYQYEIGILSPIKQNIPQVDVTDAFCGQNGRIKVNSPTSYTAIRLSNSSEISTDTAGDYQFLTRGGYLLELDSDDCGTQEMFIQITESSASIDIDIEPDVRCPVDFRVSASIKGYNASALQWIVNNRIVPSPNNITIEPISRYSIQAGFPQYGECYSRTYYSQPTTYMSITHSVNYTDLCSGKGLVTLNYPSYVNISLVRDSNGITIPFNDTESKVFEVEFGMQYDIFAENCYGPDTSYSIMPVLPYPVLVEDEFPAGHGSCLYNTAFTIANSEMYSSVALSYDGMQYSMVDGRIEDVPRVKAKYNLKYNYQSPDGKKCGIQQELDKLDTLYFVYENPSANDINYTMALSPQYPYPTCDSQSYGVVYDVNFTSPTESYSRIYYTYSANGFFEFVSRRDPSCFVDGIKFTRPTFPLIADPPTISVTMNASCIYTQGQVTVNSTRNDLAVSINGYSYYATLEIGLNNYTLSPRDYQFVFTPTSTAAQGCSYTLNVTVYNDLPNYKFQYEQTQGITNCTAYQVASIKVTDYQKYTELSYLGVNATDGVISNLEYPTLQISFDYMGVCAGTIEAYKVSLNIKSVVMVPQFIKKPTCSNTDGLLAYNLTVDGVSNQAEIYLGNTGYTYTSVPVAPGPNQTFRLILGSCVFEDTLDIDLDDPKITYTVSQATCTAPPIIDIQVANPNVDFGFVNSSDPNAYTSALYPQKLFYASAQQNFDLPFTVHWNHVCQKKFTAKVVNPVTPVPIYEVTYASGCGQQNITVTVKNHQLFTTLEMDGIPFDSNGQLTYIPNIGNNAISYVYKEALCMENNSGPDLVFQLNVTLPRGASSTREVCTGANDATLSLPKASGNYQLIRWTGLDTAEGPEILEKSIQTFDQQTLPTVFGSNLYIPINGLNLAQSDNDFTNLPSGFYTLINSNFDNPFCPVRTDLIITGNEPSLSINSLEVCSATQSSSLNITFGIDSSLAYNISIDGVLQVDHANLQLLPGANHTVQVNITEPICRRRLPVVTHSVNVQTPFEAQLDTSDCETVVLSSPASGNYRININNSKDATNDLSFTYAFNETNSNQFKLDIDSGDYTVQFINIDSGCSSTQQSITIDGCSAKKKNLGWIAAVIIGAILVAMLAAFGIYKYKQRAIGTKVKEIDDPIQLKTVPIFTGGKVANIDKF